MFIFRSLIAENKIQGVSNIYGSTVNAYIEFRLYYGLYRKKGKRRRTTVLLIKKLFRQDRTHASPF